MREDKVISGTIWAYENKTLSILAQDGNIFWIDLNERRDIKGDFFLGQCVMVYYKINGHHEFAVTGLLDYQQYQDMNIETKENEDATTTEEAV